MNSPADTVPAASASSPVFGSLIELTKPGVTRLVALTTLLGAAIAPGSLQWGSAALTMLGTLLVVASANALNMVLEEDVDAKMARTRNRPLPSGRISIEVALAFGVTLGALGLFVLWFSVNELTGMLAGLSLIIYVLIYTPLKGVSPMALYVGAVPGAAPPLLGFAGVWGELSTQAWALFLVLFAWQIPHFLAITVFRREEYAAAGLKVMPVAQGLAATKIAIGVSSVALVVVTAIPTLCGMGGVTYVVLAGTSGFAFAFWAMFGRRLTASRIHVPDDVVLERWAKSLFFASMPYLVLLFGTLAATAR